MTPIDHTLSAPPAPLKANGQQLKEGGAAKDFEAILVAQLFQTFRESGSGWLDGGNDSASDTAFSMGEQQLAKTIAHGRGFGIARIIEAALNKSDSPTVFRP